MAARTGGHHRQPYTLDVRSRAPPYGVRSYGSVEGALASGRCSGAMAPTMEDIAAWEPCYVTMAPQVLRYGTSDIETGSATRADRTQCHIDVRPYSLPPRCPLGQARPYEAGATPRYPFTLPTVRPSIK